MRERLGHVWRTDAEIVIAQDRIALRALKAVEDSGAFPCDGDGPFMRKKFVGDKVAGEKDRIRAQAVDVIDGFTKKERFGKFVEMDIAQLGDAEAIEGRGKVGKTDLGVSNLDDVARDLAGVKRQPGRAGESCSEEVATGQFGRRGNVRRSHTFMISGEIGMEHEVLSCGIVKRWRWQAIGRGIWWS